MDLVRKILLAMEAHPHGFAPDALELDGYSEEQIGYHAYLMGEAGLIESIECTTSDSEGPEALPRSITWQGYEFLEAAREPGRWAEARQILHKAGGGSFQVWTAVLTELVKKSVGL
jgi:hypothetical protein